MNMSQGKDIRGGEDAREGRGEHCDEKMRRHKEKGGEKRKTREKGKGMERVKMEGCMIFLKKIFLLPFFSPYLPLHSHFSLLSLLSLSSPPLSPLSLFFYFAVFLFSHSLSPGFGDTSMARSCWTKMGDLSWSLWQFNVATLASGRFPA